MEKFNLVLASASPRRSELLLRLGISFDVAPVNIDESQKENELPTEYAKRLAEAKARTCAQKLGKKAVYLAADTIVVLGNKVLGKPKDRTNAKTMLKLLSGKTHTVITAVCAYLPVEKEVCHTISVSTKVKFKQLSDSEIEWYLSTNEPYDKAGAYAAQGSGAYIIESVEGSYTNVIGLPLAETVSLLSKLNVKLPFEPAKVK